MRAGGGGVGELDLRDWKGQEKLFEKRKSLFASPTMKNYFCRGVPLQHSGRIFYLINKL